MGNSSIRRGRATMEEPLRKIRDIPATGRPSRGRAGPPRRCSPGLLSRRVSPRRGLPLSDQSSAAADRNPRRTFYEGVANAVPNASRRRHPREYRGKHRDLRALPTSRNSHATAASRRLRTMSGQSSRTAPQIRARFPGCYPHPTAAPSLRGSLAPWNSRAPACTIAPAWPMMGSNAAARSTG